MKVLIGINPKGHIHLGTDEMDGLNTIGLQCRPIRYGRKSYSVNSYLGRISDAVFNSFNIIAALYKMKPDILYLNSRLEPVASVRDFITLFLIRCFYYRKLKFAIKSHGSDMAVLHSSSFLYKHIIIPYLTRHVNLWFFLSKQERSIVSRYNPVISGRTSVTCNIIEPSRHVSNEDFRNKYKLNNDKLKVIFISRVIYEKGVFEFLKAIPLVEYKDQCDFILVGDGDALGQAKQLAGELGVDRIIRFLGWVEQEEAENFFDCVDILVFPTFHGEGFPMVLFKAVASGLPIVTTKIRAAIDYLKMPENVLWVDPKSEQQVADAINQLVKNRELRTYMSINNKKLAPQFSRDKICSEMSEAFMSI